MLQISHTLLSELQIHFIMYRTGRIFHRELNDTAAPTQVCFQLWILSWLLFTMANLILTVCSARCSSPSSVDLLPALFPLIVKFLSAMFCNFSEVNIVMVLLFLLLCRYHVVWGYSMEHFIRCNIPTAWSSLVLLYGFKLQWIFPKWIFMSKYIIVFFLIKR